MVAVAAAENCFKVGEKSICSGQIVKKEVKKRREGILYASKTNFQRSLFRVYKYAYFLAG